MEKVQRTLRPKAIVVHTTRPITHIIRYVFEQILWLLAESAKLINAMGIGVLWIWMTGRCLLFAFLDLPYFIPHCLWYMLTPNVIRRVAYRSSRKTKMKNMEMLFRHELERDGQEDHRRWLDAEFFHRRRGRKQKEQEAQRRLGNKEDAGSDDNEEPSNSNSKSQIIINSNRNSTSNIVNSDSETQDMSNSNDNPQSLSETWPRPHHQKRNQTSLELLAGSINPADGSFVYGLPLNVQHDLEELQKQQDQHNEHQHHLQQQQQQQQKGKSRSPEKEHVKENMNDLLNEEKRKEVEHDRFHSNNRNNNDNTKDNENGSHHVHKHTSSSSSSSAEQPNTITDAMQKLKRIFWIDRHGQHNNNAAPTAPHITTNAIPAIATAESPLLSSFAHNISFASTASSTSESSDDEEDEEDRRNLHNRATLDIYLPVPLDTLFRFMDQERKSEAASAANASSIKGKEQTHRVHEHHQRHFTLKRKKFPIIIAINGGAWIIGCYFWSSFISRVLAARGYVVFCPDYRNFPQTTMEGMTLDVSDAIAWVLNNAERYNGDLDDVTLLGQSAGAHLTMMSLLSQAHLSAFEANTNTSNNANISTKDNKNPLSDELHQQHSLHSEILLPDHDGRNTIPPSSVAYNVPRYNPRQSIHNYVGLSGIYNVKGLIRHLDRRGLYRNVLYQIAGSKSEIGRFSLPNYFDEHRRHLTGEVLPDNIFDFLPANMFFIHGDSDKSAPVTESANLVYLMRNAQRDALIKAYQANPEKVRSGPTPVTLEFILVPGATHTDAIIEEPLACGSSHVVEFLVHYRLGGSDKSMQSERRTPSLIDLPITASPNISNAGATTGETTSISNNNMSDHGTPITQTLTSLPIDAIGSNPYINGSKKRSKLDDEEENGAFPIIPLRQPDGILLTPIPHKSRTWLMRLAGKINPF